MDGLAADTPLANPIEAELGPGLVPDLLDRLAQERLEASNSLLQDRLFERSAAWRDAPQSPSAASTRSSEEVDVHPRRATVIVESLGGAVHLIDTATIQAE
jgi:hypothetical protein